MNLAIRLNDQEGLYKGLQRLAKQDAFYAQVLQNLEDTLNEFNVVKDRELLAETVLKLSAVPDVPLDETDERLSTLKRMIGCFVQLNESISN